MLLVFAALAASCQKMPSPTPPAARIELDPTTLTFEAHRNGAIPTSRTVAVDNAGGRELAWSVSDDATWLQISPAEGDGDHSTITVSVTTTDMSPDSYTATITVTGSAAENSPQTVAVTYIISEASPHIEVDSASLSFVAPQNGPAPDGKVFHISNGGGGTLNWTVSDEAEWLSLNPTNGSNSAAITATITTTDLAIDTYTGTITVTSDNADNSPQTVAVTYRVAVPVPRIHLDSTEIHFAAVQNGVLPEAKGFRITNSGGGTLEWSISDNASWLSVNPTSGTSNSAVITTTISTTSLSPNTYTGRIFVSSTNAPNSPQTIDVTYIVNAAPPHIEVDSTSLTFGATQDGVPPSAKTFRITNTGGGILNWSVSDDAPWLNLNPTGAASNTAVITASITATDMPENTYYATITVSSTNADNSPQTIAVTYRVSATPPHIQLSTDWIGFQGFYAGALPPTQTFTISNTGGGILNWSVTDNSAWLTVSPTNGSSNSAQITVSVTSSELTPTNYVHTAEITVSDANADNNLQTIEVWFLVLSAKNMIILDDYAADLGETEVQIGMYVANPEPIYSLTLPLELRSISGGAYIAGRLSFSILNRIYESGLMDVETFTSFPTPAVGNACSGPTSRTYLTPGEIDYVSPDALWWIGVTTSSRCLSAGIDNLGLEPSLVLMFDVNTNVGTFEVDTCCISPGNHVRMTDCSSVQANPLDFYKAVVTIGQGRLESTRRDLKAFLQRQKALAD